MCLDQRPGRRPSYHMTLQWAMVFHVNTNCYSHDTIGVKRMVHAHAQFAQSWTRGFLARVLGLDGWKVSYSLSRLGRTQLGRSAH